MQRLSSLPRAHDAMRLYYQSHDTTRAQAAVACSNTIARR